MLSNGKDQVADTKQVDGKALAERNVWRDASSDMFIGDRADALCILRDISSALHNIHLHNKIHNDIKPAKILYSKHHGATLRGSGMSTKQDDRPSNSGTPYYVPPEYIGLRLRGTASDVWALGVTMLYVLRKYPLPDARGRRNHPQHLHWMITDLNRKSHGSLGKEGQLSAISQMQRWLHEVRDAGTRLDLSDEVESLVAKMLVPDPNDRITMAKVVGQLFPAIDLASGLTPASSPLIRAIDGPRAPVIHYASKDGAVDGAQTSHVPTEISAGNELDNDNSIYPGAGSVVTIDDSFSSKIAEKIRKDLGFGRQHITPNAFAQLVRRLPDLLEQFSTDLNSQSTDKFGRDAGFYISTQRQRVSQQLKTLLYNDLFNQNSDTDPQIIAELENPKPGINWTERQPQSIKNFSSNEPYSPPEDYLDTSQHVSHPEVSTFDLFSTIFDGSPAYARLLATIRTEVLLDVPQPNIMLSIGRTITSQFLRTVSVKGKSAVQHSVSIIVDWQPLEFLSLRGHTRSPENAILEAIVLGGTSNNAEASTCLEYMQRTWPVTAPQTLRSLQSLFCNTIEGIHESLVQYSTEGALCLEMSHHGVLAKASGSETFLGEVAEQLAWLGAAMRNVKNEAGPTSVVSSIQRVHRPKSDTNLAPGQDMTDTQIHFAISFSERNLDILHDAEVTQALDNGQCWYPLFRNSVIVEGFPIRRRELADTGLEVDLDLMAALINAKRLNVFRGIPMIKGFSALLYPIERTTDTIIWHLVYNQDGSHISFMEGVTCHSIELPLDFIEKSRHIIGWCKEAKLFVGASDAKHPVRPSTLPRVISRSPLQDKSLASSRLIRSHKISKGLRENPQHLGRTNDYYTRMMWLQTRKIILWDEGDKRGWLADGLSVLLHLLRAHIEHHSTGPFQHIFRLRPDCLKSEGETHSPAANVRVLFSDANLNLHLFPDGDVRLKHRILDLYNTLEQIVDHQDADDLFCRQAGYNPRPCSSLEGWSFKDCAVLSDFVELRTADLGTHGSNWIELTRSLRTAVLFGSDFGDMIQPNRFAKHCTWAQVPTSQFLLAALVQDLGVEQVPHSSGQVTTTIQGGELEWHSPGGIVFQSCPCSETSTATHHNFVQVLLPRDTSTKFPPHKLSISQDDGFHRGAVIFGYNPDFGWRWDDSGTPTRSVMPTSVPPEVNEPTPPPTSNDTESDPGSERYATSLEPEIAIICALPKELCAVTALFECQDTRPPIDNDPNSYKYGHLAGYSVVAAALPFGKYGIATAGSVATNLRRSFPQVSFCLLVGIGAGIPRLAEGIDIRLGDVVVGISQDGGPDLLWHGTGKFVDGVLENSRHTLQGPPTSVRRLVARIQSNPDRDRHRLKSHLKRIAKRFAGYGHPGAEHDKLYMTPTTAQLDDPGDIRDHSQLQKREARSSHRPRIHYGPISTGHQLIKDAVLRDRLGADFNAYCIEMEAGGVTDEIPCLVVRGICDYADGYKNDVWQNYAAATAAAYAAYFLTEMRGESLGTRPPRRSTKRQAEDVLQGQKRYRQA